MIESFDVPEHQVAKWAGITSAVFSLAQCLTGIPWGRASDRFGRKPVILTGLTCTMAACIFFGFSRTLAWAICARALAGLSNGNVGIIRTTVAELVPEKELQPRAFSVMPLIWTIGSIFGPAFGGALANPAKRYPKLFGDNKFFNEYPFALPNLVACVFFTVGLSTGFLFLQVSSRFTTKIYMLKNCRKL
jgi:MFS family permease